MPKEKDARQTVHNSQCKSLISNNPNLPSLSELGGAVSTCSPHERAHSLDAAKQKRCEEFSESPATYSFNFQRKTLSFPGLLQGVLSAFLLSLMMSELIGTVTKNAA